MTQTRSGALRREDWMRRELARRDDRAATAAPRGEVTVPVAVLRFEPAAIVAGAMAFAAGLSPADAGAWLGCYTRAVFLFGNPANLAARHPAVLVAPDGSAAWLGVLDSRRADSVRRLLRPVEGELPAGGPADGVTGGGAAAWLLRVAVRGLDLPRYLIHVHHTVAEAVLTGVLPATDAVALRHVDALDADEVAGSGYAYVRIAPHDDGHRVVTALTGAPAR
jgi:hypothetical protein